MRSKNQLPGGPSLRAFANNADEETMSPMPPSGNAGTARAGQSKASGRLRPRLEVVDRAEASDWLMARDAAFRTTAGSDLSWRSILASKLLAVIKAIGGFAARSADALSSGVLAAMSWTIAQILAGCAEYCQAMYPTFVELDEPADTRVAESGPRSGQQITGQLSSPETGARGTITPLPLRLRSATSSVDADPVDARTVRTAAVHWAPARWRAAQGEAKKSDDRTNSRGWRASITSPVAEFWLRLRHERETRRATRVPRALDVPTLGNSEMSRHPTENYAGIGDRYP
jgi:hypothetical protein